METVKQQLLAADRAMERLFVRGEDVYTLIKARGALKLAYDALAEKEEDDASRSQAQ